MTEKPHRYAEGTEVPVERTRAEIERLLRAHRATGFATMWDKDRFGLMFELNNRRVRFDVPVPSPKEYPTQKRWDAEERRRWRALLLILKAKLELVASGDADFDSEFLANLVLPGGETIGARVLPSLSNALDTGNMPPMLPRHHLRRPE
jgi:hypothetical protein